MDRRSVPWRSRSRRPTGTEGPTLSALTFPIGFYVDRLSAVMMMLISSIGTIIMLLLFWKLLSYLLYLLSHNHTHAGNRNHERQPPATAIL